MPVKLRELCLADFQVAADTGRCPSRLFSILVLIRSQLSLDTQEIEGANSVLQAMAKAAPTLRMGLASDRMKVKKGDKLTPTECVGMHQLILQRQSSEAHLARFAEVDLRSVPPEEGRCNCKHGASQESLLASRFAVAFAQRFGVALDYAWTPTPVVDGAGGFVICWSYYRKYFIADGTFVMQNGIWHFRLELPIRIRCLVDEICGLPTFSCQTKTCSLNRVPVDRWVSRRAAQLDLGSQTTVRLKPAKPSAKKPGSQMPDEAAAAAPPDLDLAPILGEGGMDIDFDIDDPELLTKWLGEVMEGGGDVGEDDRDDVGDSDADSADEQELDEDGHEVPDQPEPDDREQHEAAPHAADRLDPQDQSRLKDIVQAITKDNMMEVEQMQERMLDTRSTPIQTKDLQRSV